MKEKNCYFNGVRCKNLLDHHPYCEVNKEWYMLHSTTQAKATKSEVTDRAILDSSICGDYIPIE